MVVMVFLAQVKRLGPVTEVTFLERVTSIHKAKEKEFAFRSIFKG